MESEQRRRRNVSPYVFIEIADPSRAASCEPRCPDAPMPRCPDAPMLRGARSGADSPIGHPPSPRVQNGPRVRSQSDAPISRMLHQERHQGVENLYIIHVYKHVVPLSIEISSFTRSLSVIRHIRIIRYTLYVIHP